MTEAGFGGKLAPVLNPEPSLALNFVIKRRNHKVLCLWSITANIIFTSPTYFLQWIVKPAHSDAVVSLMGGDVVGPVVPPRQDQVQVLGILW